MVEYNPKLFKAKREILGLSQKQLADECYLSVMTIHNVETKNHVYPSTNLLVGLVLDIIAARQGQSEELARLERNWKSPKYRARFTQPLMEE